MHDCSESHDNLCKQIAKNLNAGMDAVQEQVHAQKRLQIEYINEWKENYHNNTNKKQQQLLQMIGELLDNTWKADASQFKENTKYLENLISEHGNELTQMSMGIKEKLDKDWNECVEHVTKVGQKCINQPEYWCVQKGLCLHQKTCVVIFLTEIDEVTRFADDHANNCTSLVSAQEILGNKLCLANKDLNGHSNDLSSHQNWLHKFQESIKQNGDKVTTHLNCALKRVSSFELQTYQKCGNTPQKREVTYPTKLVERLPLTELYANIQNQRLTAKQTNENHSDTSSSKENNSSSVCPDQPDLQYSVSLFFVCLLIPLFGR
ncbi:hypothetical protein RFI_20359 [Reticulomyxa filosa]|uniref:Uncharacterized protein n=1 Tax=Reticulomyxa filosa TaxID=46433 RepID=X6MTK3_RETFI|nr:hypothetical protein RFI_20359 [Reticulomyxa filosa]|eukprot:ETO16976.1 hypothetical protein RFI_20359 [Reticulomyxa filosa]